MNIDYPFHSDGRGRTATATDERHVGNLIEEFLFTKPEERINRPDFGSGLAQLVFAQNSPELAATIQYTIQTGLQRWLDDLIEVQHLQVTGEDASIRIVVRYRLRRTGEPREYTYPREGSR